MDKKGKLASLIFVVITLLPLLGLLIMDYQLKKANDITGAYLEAPAVAYLEQNLVAGIMVVGVLIAVLLVFLVGRFRKARDISTGPLAKINNEIENIDERLKDV